MLKRTFLPLDEATRESQFSLRVDSSSAGEGDPPTFQKQKTSENPQFVASEGPHSDLCEPSGGGGEAGDPESMSGRETTTAGL